MEFKILNKLHECRTVWNKLSSKKRLFDIWDYRICFFDREKQDFHFIVGEEKTKVAALVPLCFDKVKNKYSYFGGWFPERNTFFLKNREMLPLLLEQCPYNTYIEGIDPAEALYYKFSEDEFTYFLDLGKFNCNFEIYFSTFNKKRQKNFKREMKSIPSYKLFHNRLDDINRLVELNVRQYEEDSKLNDDAIKKGIYKLAEIAKKKHALEMLSLEINGQVEAVDIGILHREWYYALIGGANNLRYPNIGKLMTALDIKNAIKKKSRFIDFFATSGHWKNMWNLEKQILLKFSKQNGNISRRIKI